MSYASHSRVTSRPADGSPALFMVGIALLLGLVLLRSFWLPNTAGDHRLPPAPTQETVANLA